MSVTTENTKRLDELMKPHRTDFDVLKVAFDEVAKEEADKKKDAAKDLIRKAIDLQQRMDASERTFLSEKKKFDKELGKVINRLKNMASGKPLDDGEDEEKDKGGGDNAQS